MTIDEARDMIGATVAYVRPWCDPEVGVVTSVNDRYVFVRYAMGETSQATSPEDLRVA